MPLHAVWPRLYSPPNERPGQDLRRRPREVVGSADGRAEAGERHPHGAGEAEEGPQSGQGEHPCAAPRPTRLRAHREGLRHAPRGPEVRPREGESDPQPVSDLALEDDRRTLRASAQRARFPPPQVRPLRRRGGQYLRRMAKVFVITGPSGVGKGTLISRLLDKVPGLELSISATTRDPREGEVDGRDYHFLSTGEFERRVEEKDFLEFASYSGNRYGRR